MDYTEADFDSLTTKLDDLELTDGEKAALIAVFAAASSADDDEVTGFAYDLNPNDLSFKSFNIGMPPTKGLLGGDIGIPQVQMESRKF
jgi:hypothetical protein